MIRGIYSASSVVDVVILVPHRLVLYLLSLEFVVILFLHPVAIFLGYNLLDLSIGLSCDDVVRRNRLLDDVLRSRKPVDFLRLVMLLQHLASLRGLVLMRDGIVAESVCISAIFS